MSSCFFSGAAHVGVQTLTLSVISEPSNPLTCKGGGEMAVHRLQSARQDRPCCTGRCCTANKDERGIIQRGCVCRAVHKQRNPEREYCGAGAIRLCTE